MNTYFFSDPHYGHKNICRGVSNWKSQRADGSDQSTRDFPTLEAMNKAIVDGINGKVKAFDILYCLGDWSFGGIKNIWEFRKQINCKTIHLIFGNHDEHIEANKQLPDAWVSVHPERGIVSTAESTSDYDEPARAKELFTSTKYVKTIKVEDKTLFLSHYAHRVWDKSHHGRIHLYGHSHSTLEYIEWGKSMDVGIDNYFKLFGKYEPFSFDEVMTIMNKRDVGIVDHHNENTN